MTRIILQQHGRKIVICKLSHGFTVSIKHEECGWIHYSEAFLTLREALRAALD